QISIPKCDQTVVDPFRSQLLLDRILLQARIQDGKIDPIKRLVLVEAGEYIARLSRRRSDVRLKTLRTDLLHHALHGRIDRAQRDMLWLEVRREQFLASPRDGSHHSVRTDRDDAVGI